MARELGVDLANVKGSGRKGRILKEDVKAAKDKPAQAEAPAGIPGLDLAPWPKVDFEKYGEVERVALSRVKKISGPALSRNWVMIPHVTHDDEADITELEAFRKEVNAEQKDVKVTMVALLVKACVGALRQFPEFNSSLDGDELVIKRYFNIGFAADTPQGLLVPVIKEADRKGLLEIAGELAELSGKAREGKISAEEMRGSTFTISSLGGIGGTGFTPIINAPEVAILGVTRSQDEARLGQGSRGVQAAAHGAALAQLRPPRDRRRSSGAVHGAPRERAFGHSGGRSMSEIKVPDIGDFDEVPVIEIHVSEGDEVEVEQALVTLESDKATMDVPSPEAGTVKEVLVSVNDKVSEGHADRGARRAGAERTQRLRR